MMKSGIEDAKEEKQAILGEFKIQEDVRMRNRLPGYGDFRGFDFPIGKNLAAIPNRSYRGFAKPSWSTPKHHLFIAHIRKKSLISIMELTMRNKIGEFTQERLFQRVAAIPISRKSMS